jgi:hypothetical protein
MNRSYTIYDGEEIVEQGNYDVSWEKVRKMRNMHLQQTDWWAVKDLTMSQAKKDYRQALRDLPQNYESANDAADNWPVMPDA